MSGHEPTGYMAHPAPQQGTWSMGSMASPAPSMSPSLVPSSVPAANAAPPQADDGDLIEREWVEAVKKVVRENREDPYAQCTALTLLKLQYIKKRYGEDIKVTE